MNWPNSRNHILRNGIMKIRYHIHHPRHLVKCLVAMELALEKMGVVS